MPSPKRAPQGVVSRLCFQGGDLSPLSLTRFQYAVRELRQPSKGFGHSPTVAGMDRLHLEPQFCNVSREPRLRTGAFLLQMPKSLQQLVIFAGLFDQRSTRGALSRSQGLRGRKVANTAASGGERRLLF